MAIETSELLRYCRKRLRQLYPEGIEPPLRDMTRAAMILEAARGNPRLLARAQADVFDEIVRFVLRDMGENVKHAPYVLQAWVDGVYHYYFENGSWAQTHEGSKQFQSFFEAEAFIVQNFDPNAARDSILVVPWMEVVKHA